MAFIIADRVKETTTTTGTGALTLAGTLTGFTTFAARCAVGDTLYYAIQAVDGTGAPTGEWECGLGTYSGTSTLTRTTVTSSSNSDAAVSFAAGTKQVFITMPAVQARWARERLTADRTYYVRTDGSDANTGLANTSGGAFLTLQKAVDVVSGSIDMSAFQATIQVADGTYTGAALLGPYIGKTAPIINGNTTTPANAVISGAGLKFNGTNCGKWVVRGFKISSTDNGAIYASGATLLEVGNVEFGQCSSSHISSLYGASVVVTTNYAVSGGSTNGAHMYAIGGGSISTTGQTVTLSNTPNFPAGWAWADRGNGYFEAFSMTFSGTGATGPRYTLALLSSCFTNNGGANYFPGNSAGSTTTGAQYA